MDVAERIFELYDKIEKMTTNTAFDQEKIGDLEAEIEDLEHSVEQLTAELKAEKAVHKINEQALVFCERQLGMDEKAPVLPSESVEDGQPNKTNTSCPEASECAYSHLLNICAVCEPEDGEPNFVEKS